MGSGLVKADFIAALMAPDGSATPGPGPRPPVHKKYDIVEYNDPVSGRWLHRRTVAHATSTVSATAADH